MRQFHTASLQNTLPGLTSGTARKITVNMATVVESREQTAATSPNLCLKNKEKQQQQKKQLVSPAISLIAGATGGAVEAPVTVSFILEPVVIFNCIIY